MTQTKKLIISFIVMFLSGVLFAQDNVLLSAYQDGKLAFFKDNAGNSPFTLNVLLRGEGQTDQRKYYYGALVAEFEHADLYGGVYNRIGLGHSWTFNRVFRYKSDFAVFNWFYFKPKNIEFSTSATTGMIWRFSHSYLMVFQVTGEVSYKLTKNLKFALLGQLINREDLRSEYHLDWIDSVKPSVMFGFKYELNQQ